MFFESSALGADWVPDYRASVNGRSYPIGAQATGSASIGVPIWGKTDSWKYGYARVSLNAASSVVVNRVGLEVQLFPTPISRIGISRQELE